MSIILLRGGGSDKYIQMAKRLSLWHCLYFHSIITDSSGISPPSTGSISQPRHDDNESCRTAAKHVCILGHDHLLSTITVHPSLSIPKKLWESCTGYRVIVVLDAPAANIESARCEKIIPPKTASIHPFTCIPGIGSLYQHLHHPVGSAFQSILE